MSTRVLLSGVAVGVALVVPSAASADAGGAPNCYGQFVAAGGQSGGNGEFASGTATSPAFKGPGNLTIGRDGVPLLKAIACGP